MHRLLTLICIIGLMAFASVGASAQTCDSLSFAVSAELTDDLGFEGLYKYTISGYWEVSGVEQGWALSYFLISLGAECPCLCDSTSDAIYFPDPAGTSSGIDNITEQPCDVYYLGYVQCGGMEDITTHDVVKFEVPSNTTCEPIHYGTGTWIFYSTMSPLPWSDYTDAVIIKYGEMLCSSGLSGQLPNCYECIPVPTEEKSWGSIKSIYR